MSFIRTIPPGDATDEVRSMYERQQSFWGYVPNYAKVFCYRPEVMARWGRLLAEIRRPMDDRRFELITFAAASALRHAGCSLSHGTALTAYFSPTEVLSFASGELPNGVLSDADKAMMKFARKVALDAAEIQAGDVEELRELGFAEEEIFDIAATAAGRAFFTKLLDAMGVQLDAKVLEMDEGLRNALAVGRPIDHRPPAVMT
jgi:uncharacterized peroxidase-related enzyme